MLLRRHNFTGAASQQFRHLRLLTFRVNVLRVVETAFSLRHLCSQRGRQRVLLAVDQPFPQLIHLHSYFIEPSIRFFHSPHISIANTYSEPPLKLLVSLFRFRQPQAGIDSLLRPHILLHSQLFVGLRQFFMQPSGPVPQLADAVPAHRSGCGTAAFSCGPSARAIPGRPGVAPSSRHRRRLIPVSAQPSRSFSVCSGSWLLELRRRDRSLGAACWRPPPVPSC